MVFTALLGTTMAAASVAHNTMRTVPETEYEKVKCEVKKAEGKVKARLTEVKYNEKQEWKLDDVLHRNGKPAVEYYDDDVLRAMEYYKLGKLHNTEGPARKVLNSDGTTLAEEHYFEGLLHRLDGGPAVVKKHPNGKPCEEIWCEAGKLYRYKHPARIVYNMKGKPIRKEWYWDNEKHRLDSNRPTVVHYRKKGGYMNEYHYHGKLHRDGAPAIESYHYNSGYRYEYHHHGKLHRDHGPAIVDVDGFGQRYEMYYLNGKQYSKLGHCFAKAGLWW